MAQGGFIAYFRVSTAKQGASGLGLEAQREAVRNYLNGGEWHIVAEFTEVESGRSSERPALAQALAAARVHRVPLVVANVSRLTRSSAFLHKLLEAGVDVRFCDLPKIEGPQGRFMLQQMAAVAELEAGMIADRTKKALAAAKARGVKLGGDRGKRTAFTAETNGAGREARKARSQARAAELAPLLSELQGQGVTSLHGLAKALTERGIPTARNGREWTAVQVKRVLDRIAA
jgi:DNA invertase Pin-like site-specific DNA recombinase